MPICCALQDEASVETYRGQVRQPPHILPVVLGRCCPQQAHVPWELPGDGHESSGHGKAKSPKASYPQGCASRASENLLHILCDMAVGLQRGPSASGRTQTTTHPMRHLCGWAGTGGVGSRWNQR